MPTPTTQPESRHTPGPFVVAKARRGRKWEVHGPNHLYRSDIDTRKRADAIVAEANCAASALGYADLIAACKWAKSQFRCVPHLDDPDCAACSGRNPVDRAIAKATSPLLRTPQAHQRGGGM